MRVAHALPFSGLGAMLGAVACTKPKAGPAPNPTAIQAAAIAFLARANGDQDACVHIASGPADLTGGRVTGQLQDPPAQLLAQLRGQGVSVRAFSSCSSAERDKVTYAIGWPRSSPRGFQLNADRLCGTRCGEGSVVIVKDFGDIWRATEAETLWTM